MKKVVLLGDSIRMIGYGNRVAELLEKECDIWQPDDNCRFAKYTLRMLFDCKEQIDGADVIHWNNGLWDTCDILGDGKLFTPLEEYVDNMLRIADILLAYGKKVIFATTTPTHPDYPYNSLENIQRYNEALVSELKKKGLLINDLFATMLPHCYDGLRDDLIHLNDRGIELCAKQVADMIRSVL